MRGFVLRRKYFGKKFFRYWIFLYFEYILMEKSIDKGIPYRHRMHHGVEKFIETEPNTMKETELTAEYSIQ